MLGLELRNLAWQANDEFTGLTSTVRIDVDSLVIPQEGCAAVVARPHVGRALADVVVGLTRPASGAVIANDDDVTSFPPMARRLALLPVGGGLLPHLTVAKNISFGCARSALSIRARKARVRKLAQQLNLDGALDMRPHQLSPVQRLRVAVARAVIEEPAALIVEDRSRQPSCAPAVLLGQELYLAVLVITDAAVRASAVATSIHTISEEGGAQERINGGKP